MLKNKYTMPKKNEMNKETNFLHNVCIGFSYFKKLTNIHHFVTRTTLVITAMCLPLRVGRKDRGGSLLFRGGREGRKERSRKGRKKVKVALVDYRA